MKKVLLAIFYAVGFWGSVHLLIAAIEAINKHNLGSISALRVAKLDLIFGHLTDKLFFFIGGWIGFALTVVIFYYLVVKKSGED